MATTPSAMNKDLPLPEDASPLLTSIIPNLHGGRGHVYGYHCAVAEAAKHLGWKHIALVTPDPAFTNLPESWRICLDQGNTDLKINPFRKLKGAYRWFTTLDRALREIPTHKQPTVILFEGFGSLQLGGLAATLLLNRPANTHVWLLYYTDVHRSRISNIYLLLNKLIKNILREGHFQLLTDSELLAESFADYFGEPVTHVPMLPGSSPAILDLPPTKTDILCWWPGEPRWEKGLAVMQHLSTLPSQALVLLAAEDSNLTSTPGGSRIQLLPMHLSEEEYLHWLAASDLILLPYDQNTYQERTSGIFLETILAGKIPVVSQGTWMAWQLSQHQLSELVVDWYRNDLIEHLSFCARDPNLAEKIKKMQRHFQRIHTVDGYAAAIKALFARSQNRNTHH
ncbi:MAG: hypothetical protein H7Y37_18450 [Anaerolineae bacterium]|nr:hypothetical protein [Gloeobacterales cyanobacterium ES-bin-313]